MQQRDLLKDQIEQMGKVLASILSDFLGLKANGDITQGMEASNERFQSELNIDIEELIRLNKSELAESVKHKKFTPGHIVTLAEYMKELGLAKAENNNGEGQLYLEKAIDLLDIADEISNTTSLDRINKKSAIVASLNQGFKA